MSEVTTRVVIVGAGHAGATAAALLRQYGFQGRLALLSEEPIAPYHRPPLSKAWLKGSANAQSIALRPADYYAQQDIELQLNTRVVGIQREAQNVVLADNTTVPYDYLIIATGARPITLSVAGADLAGVLYLRTAADADALKDTLVPGKALAVVGGGYIGLEVAASCRALGVEVVVLERESRLLARVASEPLAQFYHQLHRQHGVQIELNALVSGFQGTGRVSGVQLADGRIINCDSVLVGIGAQPNDELAVAADLSTARGIMVDHQSRTSDKNIFAIGDVAQRPMPLYDNRLFRLESVPNTLEQARQAACAITGRSPPADEVPMQWSDQYDAKLQIAGYALDVDQLIVRGDPASGSFSVFHLHGDRIQAVEAVNSLKDFVTGRQLVGNRKPVDIHKLANAGIALKDIAA